MCIIWLIFIFTVFLIRLYLYIIISFYGCSCFTFRLHIVVRISETARCRHKCIAAISFVPIWMLLELTLLPQIWLCHLQIRYIITCFLCKWTIKLRERPFCWAKFFLGLWTSYIVHFTTTVTSSKNAFWRVLSFLWNASEPVPCPGDNINRFSFTISRKFELTNWLSY